MAFQSGFNLPLRHTSVLSKLKTFATVHSLRDSLLKFEFLGGLMQPSASKG
jgi:hypothetical protein